MYVYCPDHTIKFSVLKKEPVLCETGHYLGRLPSSLRYKEAETPAEFWEFCCGCKVFRPTNIDAQAVEKCAFCGLTASGRFWCDKCYTISFETIEPSRREFTISPEGFPYSGCPVCAQSVALSGLYEHKCKTRHTAFTSGFDICPCCKDPIGPLPSFPVLAAEFLARVSTGDKLTVDFNILEIDNNLLVVSPDGEFLLIGNGASQMGPIILPKRTRFTTERDYRLCSSLYDLEKPGLGEVRILSPVVAGKVQGGWRLVERGRLEVVPPEIKTDEAESAEGFPTSVADYLKSLASSNIVKHDVVDNTLKLNPTGQLLLRGDPDIAEIQAWYIVPRLGDFSGEEGFLKYFNSYYKSYYECGQPDSGEVWIIKPAIVTKTKAGWKLHQKGLLEIRRDERRDGKGDSLEKQQPPAGSHEGPLADTASEQVTVQPEIEPSVRWSPVKIVLLMAGAISILTIGIWWLRNKSTPPGPTNGNINQNTGTPSNNLSPSAPTDMVYVPTGTFMMGRNDGNELERPAHSVSINKAFFIDRNEVKCQDYESFLAVNPQTPAPMGWKDRRCPAGKGEWPVSGVDWYGADAYAKSKGRRLPTEEEWEYVARGREKNLLYPWGNSWDENAANAAGTSPGHIVAVGSYPAGAAIVSGVRILDMVGNVWEWTSSDLTSFDGPLPKRLSNRENVSLGKVIRGGAWNSNKKTATTTYRMGYPPRDAGDYLNTGFRCVMDAPSQ